MPGRVIRHHGKVGLFLQIVDDQLFTQDFPTFSSIHLQPGKLLGPETYGQLLTLSRPHQVHNAIPINIELKIVSVVSWLMA